jgi:HSP20 family protein
MMRRFSDEMDRLFQGFGLPRTFGMAGDVAWVPPIEAFMRDGAFVVRAELPGLTEKDVSVELAGDVLTIKGERKEEKTSTEGDYYRTERSYGTFQRAVALPEGAAGDRARASFKNGVLEISVPVTPTRAADVRKIEVSPG